MFVHIVSVLFLGLALKVALPTSNLTHHAACTVLSVQLPGAVHYPGSTTFSDAMTSYFSQQAQETRPLCVVKPASASQVSRIVQTMSHFLIVGGRFAIRSGGHTRSADIANIQNGVTVDLSLLNQVQVDDDHSVVSLGPGARWRNVWQVLDPMGLAVAGGRDAGVGVGGYLLGGGLSFLGPAVGWGCDEVLEYDVVLANGEIVTASKKSHPDLFLALKGGSHNFGIVTRFAMRTHPLARFWGGFVAHSLDTAPKQVKAFSSFMGNEPRDPHAAIFQSYAFLSGNKVVSNNIAYTKKTEKPTAYETLFDPTTAIHSGFRMDSMASFAEETSMMQAYNSRHSWYTTTFAHTPTIYSTLYSIWAESLSGISHIAGMNWALTLQPAPSEGYTNSLGLDEQDERLVIALLSVSYSNSTDDSSVNSAAQQFIASIENSTKAAGVYHPLKYMNYADRSQDVIASYGATNKARLQVVSKKYDPRGLFQKGVPGGFKLFTG